MTFSADSKEPSTPVFVGAIAAFTLFAAVLGALFVGGDRWWIAFASIGSIPVILGLAYTAFVRFAIERA